MNWRTFRLHELHRRIDDVLRMELHRACPDMLEIWRLKTLKRAIKDRLARRVRTPGPAV